jgi:hypothetical protein
MDRLPWQLITHWLSLDGSEYVRTDSFATIGEARSEAQRLCPKFGLMEDRKLLKGLQIVGDFIVQLYDASERLTEPPA